MTSNYLQWLDLQEKQRTNQVNENLKLYGTQVQQAYNEQQVEATRQNLALQEQKIMNDYIIQQQANANQAWYNQQNIAARNAELAETSRASQAKEAETYRSNVVRETETYRSNVQNETAANTRNGIEIFKTVTGLAGDIFGFVKSLA